MNSRFVVIMFHKIVCEICPVVFQWPGEADRQQDRQTDRVCLCMCVCVCARVRERERERERDPNPPTHAPAI